MTIRLTALSVALMAGTSLYALDVEQAQGGLVFGNDNAKSTSFSWRGGLASKQIDQGYERSADAVFQTGGTARFWGLGLSANGAFAVGQEYTTYPTDNDPVTFGTREVKPGELIQLNLKADYLVQFDGVYGEGQPFIQLIPHIEKVTYPNQPANDFKDEQVYFGADVWWSTPLEGLDIGGSVDWNLQDQQYRGAFGAREFLQFAPYDLALWQLGNYGDSHYRRNFVDTENRGWTYLDVGAKVTTPMAWREWWTYASVDWTYWLNKDDRDYRETLGQDVGDLVFAVGIEWRAE